ncbi:hypothetical protein [Anaplasma capra]|uniref:hypothetical protein n=1 Tax=Anaplasma capra TaxID=1562740 RepID=UPI0021D57B11|nr:hypothetical protein [Anaplasma capra]MCU7611253.1 hypothetical protein [Anaplasma capra]MCU7612625.1 hypothetical protein [Anaplasma capra]
MPSVGSVVFLATFAVVLYVLLTYAVNQFIAWDARRSKRGRKKSKVFSGGSGFSVPAGSKSSKPPQHAVSPYIDERYSIPGRVIGVECVSQVFAASSKGRGR